MCIRDRLYTAWNGWKTCSVLKGETEDRPGKMHEVRNLCDSLSDGIHPEGRAGYLHRNLHQVPCLHQGMSGRRKVFWWRGIFISCGNAKTELPETGWGRVVYLMILWLYKKCIKNQWKRLIQRANIGSLYPVSYTHLDVYKRQVMENIHVRQRNDRRN